MFYRRRLPHWIPPDAVVFLTWRLAGSMPARAPEIRAQLSADASAVCSLQDRYDQPSSGPFWLQEPGIAAMLVNALRYGEAVRRFYTLYAWVIMPNHVHVILQPHVDLRHLMRWLKGRTGRIANRILGRTGTAFWQDESFDHWIRSAAELRNSIAYVESNPVKAGLVAAPEQWPWSSAQFKADDPNRSSAPPLLFIQEVPRS